MRRTSRVTLVVPLILPALIVILSYWGSAEAETKELSQGYVCAGSSHKRIPVHEMLEPVIGYIEPLGRWYTFEKGEVALDHRVTHYFTWDGAEWSFHHLPFIGVVIEVPHDYESWHYTVIDDLGITISMAFNSGYQAPNCWSEETLQRETVTPVLAPLPPGVVGDL